MCQGATHLPRQTLSCLQPHRPADEGPPSAGLTLGPGTHMWWLWSEEEAPLGGTPRLGGPAGASKPPPHRVPAYLSLVRLFAASTLPTGRDPGRVMFPKSRAQETIKMQPRPGVPSPASVLLKSMQPQLWPHQAGKTSPVPSSHRWSVRLLGTLRCSGLCSTARLGQVVGEQVWRRRPEAKPKEVALGRGPESTPVLHTSPSCRAPWPACSASPVATPPPHWASLVSSADPQHQAFPD